MGFLGGQPRGCQTLYFLLATMYWGGGLRYEKGSTPLLLVQAAEAFQTNLLKTMMQIEKSFFDLAEESTKPQNILVICDRGAMDASAYIAREQWDRILEATGNVSPEKY